MTGGWIEILFALALAHFIVANLAALLLLAGSLAALRRRRRQMGHRESPDSATSPLTLPLSVIVPAFNEEGTVVDAVRAILQSALPTIEVIVVDDGSTDATAERLTAAFELEPAAAEYPRALDTEPVSELRRSRVHPNLWLIRKANAGKADAINAGINLATYRFVLTTDADTIFEPGALLTAITTIGFDPGVNVGVGGVVRVRNGMRVEEGRIVERRLPESLLGQFQVAEYMGAMTGSRAGWDRVNGVPVLSGAFSIWRRDVLLELGGMSRETTHEDIEFTLRVHEHFRRKGEVYRIRTLPDAVVWTEAPHRWRDLYNQRKRWQRVVLECMWRYRRMIGNVRYGEVGTITMPYMLIFEALGPFIELGALVLVTVLFLQGALSPPHLALFLVASAALIALTRIVSVAADAALYGRFPVTAVPRLAAVAMLELFLYRPVILMARLMAFPEFLTGRKTWDRATRDPGAKAHA